MKIWQRNLLSNILGLLLAFIPAWLGYKEYLDLQTHDVVYLVNGIPFPGELVMIFWFVVAAIIAYIALTGMWTVIMGRWNSRKNVG